MGLTYRNPLAHEYLRAGPKKAIILRSEDVTMRDFGRSSSTDSWLYIALVVGSILGSLRGTRVVVKFTHGLVWE